MKHSVRRTGRTGSERFMSPIQVWDTDWQSQIQWIAWEIYRKQWCFALKNSKNLQEHMKGMGSCPLPCFVTTGYGHVKATIWTEILLIQDF